MSLVVCTTVARAWTAGIPNNEQYLGVDLGNRQVITGVATQGRRGSKEYVTEYNLHYSSDNRTWTVYTTEYGTPWVRSALRSTHNIHNGCHRGRYALQNNISFIAFSPHQKCLLSCSNSSCDEGATSDC